MHPVFNRISEVVLERFFSVRSALLPDWIYRLTPLGREHTKLVNQMHDFTSNVTILIYS